VPGSCYETTDTWDQQLFNELMRDGLKGRCQEAANPALVRLVEMAVHGKMG
jgi:hypothetical protein